MTTDTNSAFDSVKQAFAPMTDAFKSFQTMEVPEATRDFVKRAAGTAKDKVGDIHAGSEKVTAAIESAVTNSVSEAAKISRNILAALHLQNRRGRVAVKIEFRIGKVGQYPDLVVFRPCNQPFIKSKIDGFCSG
eukprot:gene4202-5735_t